MHPDLETAKTALKTENCTCVLALGNVIFRSSESGLKPLMDWMSEERRLLSILRWVFGKFTRKL